MALQVRYVNEGGDAAFDGATISAARQLAKHDSPCPGVESAAPAIVAQFIKLSTE
jgi:hypothetical protein